MVDVTGFAPDCLRPSMVTCHASVWVACVWFGTSAIPSCGAPLFQACRNASRSTVRTPVFASYAGWPDVVQSTAGGALAEPAVPSANAAVTMQARIFALSGDTDPSVTV